ncbi:MAG: DUF5666 domain-containing protein [Caldimonas sp.]
MSTPVDDGAVARLPRPCRRALLMAAVFLISCGGGVDSGGTGAPMAPSFASGAITGFGSVIVNGVRFDDSSAVVTDAAGNARSRNDLRLGMTAEVRGSAIVIDAAGNSVATARSIVFGSEIVGPVVANDLVARTLVVLGHSVDIAATTVFESSLAGGQAALAIGDIVEVYARIDTATGHYSATRVERKAAAASFELRGVVAGLDTAARQFSLGSTRISYAGVPDSGVPAALANGRFVRVMLNATIGAGGIWTAVALTDATSRIDDGDDADVDGLISAFVSVNQFSVNGTVVDARSASFPNGSAGIALGRRVEVEGRSVAGVLVATRVTLVTEGSGSGEEFDVSGAIVSVDAAAQTFTLRNVVVSYSGSVDFRNGTAANIVVGQRLEAKGTLSADGTRMQASSIEFDR